MATGSAVELSRQRDQRLARLGLHVGGIDDREQAAREPLRRDEVQHLEGVTGRRLVVLVVGDQAAARVGRKHFGWLEVLAGERGLARSRGSDQHDERKLGDFEGLGHRVPFSGLASS